MKMFKGFILLYVFALEISGAHAAQGRGGNFLRYHNDIDITETYVNYAKERLITLINQADPVFFEKALEKPISKQGLLDVLNNIVFSPTIMRTRKNPNGKMDYLQLDYGIDASGKNYIEILEPYYEKIEEKYSDSVKQLKIYNHKSLYEPYNEYTDYAVYANAPEKGCRIYGTEEYRKDVNSFEKCIAFRESYWLSIYPTDLFHEALHHLGFQDEDEAWRNKDFLELITYSAVEIETAVAVRQYLENKVLQNRTLTWEYKPTNGNVKKVISAKLDLSKEVPTVLLTTSRESVTMKLGFDKYLREHQFVFVGQLKNKPYKLYLDGIGPDAQLNPVNSTKFPSYTTLKNIP